MQSVLGAKNKISFTDEPTHIYNQFDLNRDAGGTMQLSYSFIVYNIIFQIPSPQKL